MKISTDGGTTWINVEQVKVLKAIDHSDGLDAEIVFKFTDAVTKDDAVTDELTNPNAVICAED